MRRMIWGLLFAFTFLFLSMEGFASISSVKILDGATATGAGEVHFPACKDRVYHLLGNVSAATGAAGVTVEVSNDNVNWVSGGTMALTLGTTITSDSLPSVAPWRYVRGNVTSISGTNAAVTLWLSCEIR